MLKSMTGFGKAAANVGGKTYNVELRSLNGKFLDLNVKIPNTFREQEMELRNLLSEKLLRGKTELLIELVAGEQALYSINKNSFRQYYEQLESLSDELGIPPDNLMEAVMRIPDVVSSPSEKLSNTDNDALLKAVTAAIKALDDFRVQEGEKLKTDMAGRIQQIKKSAQDVKLEEGKRKEIIRERLQQKLGELIASPELDEMRLEQEVLYYAERLDITEELVRLESHCDYFIEVMDDKETSKGKKLAFIGQEMGREINTLGAKANDAAIQKIVVTMKEELEKVKEQLNNVL